jgi:hypothetical protein
MQLGPWAVLPHPATKVGSIGRLGTFSPHKATNVLVGLVAGSAEAQEVCAENNGIGCCQPDHLLSAF